MSQQRFTDRLSKLTKWFVRLQSIEQIAWAKLPDTLPEKGIYVFYENDQAQYVGRTDRMRQRLQEHVRPSSNHLTATFAFIIAKREATSAGIDTTINRNALCENPQFKDLFAQSKERVRNMSIRYVEIEHPVDQYLFEVYAADVLDTPYNEFENH